MRKAELENWVNLTLGAWLFLSPWIFRENAVDYGTSWNLWVVGILVAGSAALALRNLKPWEEWINLFLGLWLILSPWVFGYTHENELLWNSILVGTVVALSAALALPIAWKVREQP